MTWQPEANNDRSFVRMYHQDADVAGMSTSSRPMPDFLYERRIDPFHRTASELRLCAFGCVGMMPFASYDEDLADDDPSAWPPSTGPLLVLREAAGAPRAGAGRQVHVVAAVDAEGEAQGEKTEAPAYLASLFGAVALRAPAARPTSLPKAPEAVPSFYRLADIFEIGGPCARSPIVYSVDRRATQSTEASSFSASSSAATDEDDASTQEDFDVRQEDEEEEHKGAAKVGGCHSEPSAAYGGAMPVESQGAPVEDDSLPSVPEADSLPSFPRRVAGRLASAVFCSSLAEGEAAAHAAEHSDGEAARDSPSPPPCRHIAGNVVLSGTLKETPLRVCLALKQAIQEALPAGAAGVAVVSVFSDARHAGPDGMLVLGPHVHMKFPFEVDLPDHAQIGPAFEALVLEAASAGAKSFLPTLVEALDASRLVVRLDARMQANADRTPRYSFTR